MWPVGKEVDRADGEDGWMLADISRTYRNGIFARYLFEDLKGLSNFCFRTLDPCTIGSAQANLKLQGVDSRQYIPSDAADKQNDKASN